jgi:hypothetical protein
MMTVAFFISTLSFNNKTIELSIRTHYYAACCIKITLHILNVVHFGSINSSRGGGIGETKEKKMIDLENATITEFHGGGSDSLEDQ